MAGKSIPADTIKAIMAAAEVEWHRVNNSTVGVMTLPNGFVIQATTGCIDPDVYDDEYGREIVWQRLEDEVWYLYGFVGCEIHYHTNVEALQEYLDKAGE